jgi:hypothetical protein
MRPTRVAATAMLLALVACGNDAAGPSTPASAGPSSTAVIDPGDGGVYAPVIDPADFVTDIDNPYFPLVPGSRWEYRTTGSEGNETDVVAVTSERKTVMGVSTTVVHDTVTADGGEVVEDTYDWYGQDKDGNLWYLGEDTKEFEHGKVKSTEGSWEAGVDGAEAGVLLPGEPEVGMSYRQEYYKGEAEDAGEILSLDERVEVTFGRFDHVLKTKDYTPLEPSLIEHKFYAKGVGPVLAVTVSGGSDREELLSFKPGRE